MCGLQPSRLSFCSELPILRKTVRPDACWGCSVRITWDGAIDRGWHSCLRWTQLIYDPSQKVGGDTFNYILAAGRGTGIIAVAVGLAVIGSALVIIGAIQRYR
jgi:hypothetical protein